MRLRLGGLAKRGLSALSGRLARRRQDDPPPDSPVPDEVQDRSGAARPTAEEEVAAVRSEAEDALARADFALEVARDMSLPTRMLAFMSWLELHPAESGPLISVILCTRDRPVPLPRAIDSVLSQRYEHWELVIVDDGDTDAVAETLAPIDDERIVVADGPRHGLGAARNAGLDRAEGEIVCYLDDDNVMHPGWLHAIADVFSRRPDIDIAYGIAIAEHRIPGDRTEFGWWPSLWQLPWSREKLLEENVSDAGAMAHRRELPEARFDESLSTGEDWDLLLRLTADREAMATPALSHVYTIDGEGRMSDDPRHRAGLEEIRRRHGGS